MQIFKVYFKIIKRNISQLSIYLITFICIAILLTTAFGGGKDIKGFIPMKNPIAFYNYDQGSAFINDFREYLAENSNIIDIPDNLNGLQDALFFRKVVYIVKVPRGFTQSFFSGKNEIQLEKTVVPDSTTTVFTDLLINRYLNTAALYIESSPGISTDELKANIMKDLKAEATVDVRSYGKVQTSDTSPYYFKFLAYALMAILILGITSIMLVFNDPDLRKRNFSSPVKILHLNLQIVLGNLVFTSVVWAALFTGSFLFFGKKLLSQSTAYMALNSFIYALVCLCISFLVGTLLKGRNAQSAIANVLTLGTCFIGGVFVPQQFLGESIRTISSFTPTYWYVKSVDTLSDMVSFNAANITPVIYNMLIQLGFAAAILFISLVLIKNKRMSNG